MGYFDDDAGWSLVPGDWPPKGRRLARVAVLLTDGSAWSVREGPIRDGEIPCDTAARLASEAGHAEVAWALPCATLVPPEGKQAVLAIAGLVEGHLGGGAVFGDPLLALARATLAARPSEIATECRSHAAGHVSYFHCAVLQRAEGRLLLEYRSWREGRVKGTPVPAGSRTLAAYREGADHVPWRVVGPGGDILLDLVHLAAEVRIERDRVRYRDMLLDVIRVAGGAVEIIDQEDLAQAEAAGWVTPADAEAVREAGGRIALSFTEVYRVIPT